MSCRPRGPGRSTFWTTSILRKLILNVKGRGNPAIKGGQQMHNFKDMTGHTIHYLHFIGKSSRKVGSHVYWYCQCTLCGELVCVDGSSVRRGHQKSCGCLRKKGNKNLTNRHLQIEKTTKHGKSYSKVYKVWQVMIDRCNNSRNRYFYNYGGRGITVCDEWHKFENFYADMGEPNGLTLERIDNDRGYTPQNCKWASRKEQASNRRTTKYVK